MQIMTAFSQYMPHGMCLSWQPWLVILWAGSDLLIFISYFAIPLALLSVLRQRPDLKHRGLVGLFAGFILLCGLTHALSIVTLWIPIYPLQGYVKLATGLVSAATAIVLFRLVPTLITIPTPSELQEANQNLKREIAAHEATLAKLRQAQHNLEAEVEERTAELKRANAQLAISTREAVHRSRNLIAVVSSIARQSARSHGDAGGFIDTFIGRLNALADATSIVMKGETRTSADLGQVVRTQLEPVLMTYGDRIKVEGQPIDAGSEAAQQISLALHELATNSQKYGALSADAGAISVSWTKRAADGDDAERLVLRWDEEISEAAARSFADAGSGGFGSRLLTKIVPTVLRGSARREVEDSTLTYELILPLSALKDNVNRDGDADLAARIVDRDFGLA